MPKQKRKPRRHHKRPVQGRDHHHPGETRAADATTIGWIVSVTTVLLCDVAAVVAHLYLRAYPQARGMVMFKELVLFAAAVIGFISLATLPVVFRVRRVPPPSGVTVFAICVALAPILALIVRNFR
jgi:hypothetical protein